MSSLRQFGLVLVICGGIIVLGFFLYAYEQPLDHVPYTIEHGPIGAFWGSYKSVLIGLLFLFMGILILYPPLFSYLVSGGKSPIVPRKAKVMNENTSLEIIAATDANEMTIDQALSKLADTDSYISSLLNADPNLPSKVQATLDFYKPSRGIFGSWMHKIRAEGRTKLLTVLNEEQRLLIEQAATFETQVMEGKRKQAEYKMFLIQNHFQLQELGARAAMIGKAYGEGFLPEDASEVKKYEAKIEIDKKHEEWKYEQLQSAAERYKMTEDNVTEGLRKRLEAALIRLDEIENNAEYSERTKREMIESQESAIQTLKFRIAARDRRLVDDES